MIHSKLASRLANIAPFHVMELAKRAAALEKEGRSIIHMSIGEPDFTAPPPVLAAAEQAIRSGVTQYTAATGLPALREAISGHYRSAFSLDIDPSRIIVTAGASAALLLASAALVDRGTRVLMPDPSYPCNRHFIAAFDGTAVLIPSGPAQRFQLTESMVREHWIRDLEKHAQGVLLASPSNPTGTSIPENELAAIVDFVRQHGGFTIVDEIYQGLSYDAPPVSALGLGDDVIVINSFSKYFNMTGWRLGWLVVPPALIPAVEKLAQNLFICPSAIAQHAAMACFTPDATAMYEARKEEFRRRRDYLVPALTDVGFDIPVRPDGAFYIYADCRRISDDADWLTQDILQKAGVAIVPGLDFGLHGARQFVRVSYATSMTNLQEAVARLRAYTHSAGVRNSSTQ